MNYAIKVLNSKKLFLEEEVEFDDGFNDGLDFKENKERLNDINNALLILNNVGKCNCKTPEHWVKVDKDGENYTDYCNKCGKEL